MKVASRALCAAIACALGIESTAAFADDASSAPSTDADLQLETITVTAEKREQSVNDIGVAVTAFSARDVEQLGFSSYKDIADQTPGLSTVNATSGGTPIFAIRGIGLDDFNSNNTSGVGVYIDNVLAAYPVFLNGQLFDIERIEVLKGPQGTLYGRNTTGGAINYISIKPTDTFDAYQTVGFGSWNTWRFNGALNGPIGNGADGRIAYSWEKGDGWQHDIDTGRAFGSTDRFAMRAQVSQFFGDITEVLLNVHATRDTGAPLSPQNETVDAVYQVPPGTYGYLSDDPRRVRVGNFDLSRDESGAGASSTVTVSFPSMTFMSIAGFDHYSRKTSDNYDGTAQTTDNIGVDDTYSLWSQEFRLSSAGTQRLNWIMGAVGSYDKINGLTAADFADLYAVPSAVVASRYVQKTYSEGAYLHGDYALTDAFKVVAGARYSRDRRSYEGGSIDVDGAFGPKAQYLAFLDDSKAESHVSGTAGVEYTPLEHWLFYGTLSTSYKAGIFYTAPALAQASLAYVAPEQVRAGEIGFKASPSKAFEIDGALYEYRYRDRQSLVLVSVADTIIATLGSVPRSKVSGGELQLKWLPPIHGLEIGAGMSHIDSEVTASPANVRGLPLVAPIDRGDVLPQSPRWSFNEIVRYEWALRDNLRAFAQLKYSRATRQLAALADPNAEYGPTSDLGLRFWLEPADGKWRTSFWIENAEDNRTINYAFSNTDGSRVIYRPQPRNAGVEFTYRF